MDEQDKKLLTQLAGGGVTECRALPLSGSNRKYYRLSLADGGTVIGVVSQNAAENSAFLGFTDAMRAAGLNVPRVLARDTEAGAYVQEDLGDLQLFGFLQAEKARSNGNFTPELKAVYSEVLAKLKEFQKKAAEVVDFSLCYPRAAFDRQSMAWDMQYFKYYFLRLAQIPFDEESLEEDFVALQDYLLRAPMDCFLYRDFQSRNIMLRGDRDRPETLTPWFIDYQGGRRGARHYDVASLLYDGKADIPFETRDELAKVFFGDEYERERPMLQAFVLVRVMQAMGAYGYRGFFERKAHFLQSIPFALKSIEHILGSWEIEIGLSTLRGLLGELAASQRLRDIASQAKPRLRVSVCSFSYKHAIPTDNSGNGGGFVFDCRALPNPGRYDEYKALTGKDQAVIDFFAAHKEPLENFLAAVQSLISQSVEVYVSRGFTSLTVSFGCTGGRHRSVFCAEATAQWLREAFDIDLELRHWEIAG